ncbi:hypothetical protein AAHC03_09395 [Spirometra sp. Aus1]
MSYRSEITIPVTKDPRTFEQRRNDMVTKLEQSYKTTSSVGPGDSDTTTVSSIKTESSTVGNRAVANPSWDVQRSKWIEDARNRFDMDVQNMRKNMFALEPLDDFDLDNWDNFGGLTGFGNEAGGSMIDQMERRMQAMRQKMDSSMRMMGAPPGQFPAGSHSVSSHFSSSSTRTINDGGVVTQSKSTSQESRQTVDGVSTGSKSHSSSTTTNVAGAGAPELLTDRPLGSGAIVPSQSGTMGGVMDFLTDAFEVGDDGLVHFKVRFDAKDFAPEDIDVTTVGNRLTVHAKKTITTAGSSTSREFSRTVDLPRSIDHEKFQCNLTQDGVLILDAPVKAPDYSSITFDSGHNLSIRPKDSSVLKSTDASLSIRGQSGPLVLNDGAGGRKLHLEVPIDEGYAAEDLSVRMEANKIIVSGKRESNADKSVDSSTSKSAYKSSQFQEFTRTFEVPETIDPFTVSAVLNGKTLVVEAPLHCTV